MCRTPNTIYQHPGQQCTKCEWVCVRSILTDNWTTSSIYLHCLCQANPVISSIKDREIHPQEDITQDPGLCRWTHSVLFKGGIAAAPRILGKSETHTSQHEPLLVTSPNIQTQHNSFLYFPLLISIKGFSQQQEIWEFIQNQRGWRHVVMRKGVVSGGLGSGETEECKTTKSYYRA